MDLFLILAVIGILAAIFLLFITLVPIDITLITRNTGSAYRHTITVVWGLAGFRLVAGEEENFWEILVLNHAVFRRRADNLMPKPSPEPGPREKGSTGLLTARKNLPLFLDLARAAWRQTRLRSVSVRVRAGFADPAQTGLVFGYVQALRGIASPWEVIAIEMEPLFDRVALEWEAVLGIRIRHPAFLFPSGFRLAW
ncbi:MAG: DUF2953 domain-containing protein, partial [Methanomicrobiales archaeon]|nr:DUF2953 domain-containing protein [Methanomicrobiales archaeon]